MISTFPDLDCSNYMEKCRKTACKQVYKSRTNEVKLKLFAQPFDLEDSPDDFQVELIELQGDMETKRNYSKNSLTDFYKFYESEKYPQFVPTCKKDDLSLLSSNFSAAVNNFSPK